MKVSKEKISEKCNFSKEKVDAETSSASIKNVVQTILRKQGIGNNLWVLTIFIVGSVFLAGCNLDDYDNGEHSSKGEVKTTTLLIR